MARGGKRPGAGRKPITPGEKRVFVCFSLSRQSKRIIDRLRKSGVAVGPMIDDFFKGIAEDEKFTNFVADD